MPGQLSKVLPDEAATLAMGRSLSGELQGGEVLALVGDLGAGKTTLTRGLVSGLGGVAEVTSPTFALVQEYRGGRLAVYHFDFYRVGEAEELLDLGWDDYLEREGVVIVEWPYRYAELLPSHARWFRLSHHPDGRLIEEFDPSS